MVVGFRAGILTGSLACCASLTGCGGTPPATPGPVFTVSGISPASGSEAGQTTVAISGSGFSAGTAVTLGGREAEVLSIASGTITATTPPHAPGVVDVVVTNPTAQSVRLGAAFTYVGVPAPPPLTINIVSPDVGPVAGGTIVQIFGEGFEPGAAAMFGGEPISVETVSSRTMTGRVPAHAAGPVDVVVRNPSGASATKAAGFTYAVVPAGGPLSIAAVAPRRGSADGSTLLRITGSGFNAGTTLTVDGVQVRVGVFEPTQFVFLTPPHTPGRVEIGVRNQNGDHATAEYTYVSPDALELDGTWSGCAGDHCHLALNFTIENRRIASVSCNGVPHTFSSPALVSQGRFEVSENAFSFSGAFSSDSSGTGKIRFGACVLGNGSATNWEADKR